MTCKCKCHQKYSLIQSKQKADDYQQLAQKLVQDGCFRLVYSYNGSFTEQQYVCNGCGTKFVLWMDAVDIRSGGEWRSIEAR